MTSPNPASPKVSLLIPARHAGLELERTVVEAHRYLKLRYADSFEILLIPNPKPGDESDPTIEIARRLEETFDRVRSIPHVSPPGTPGKGAALKTGFLASKGEWVFFTDADLPYDLEFFDGAAKKLEEGYDLVSGNRRLSTSHFHVPVKFLPLAYGRHRLGLWFNFWVRCIFPIATTDTQAGIKAMSRRLASKAFTNQACPGFFFDLEIFLAARGNDRAATELPVTLYLNSEKSTVRILRESGLAAYWLTRIFFRNLAHRYGKPTKKPDLLSFYPRASLLTRFFLYVRWKLTPYPVMASYLPRRGKILDLGCGHGLFSLALALESAGREIHGTDHDEKRIALARQAASSFHNLRFELQKGSVQASHELIHETDGIAMIDVMHYFDPKSQEELARTAFSELKPNGTLIVREVNPSGNAMSGLNRLYEKIATGIGFTRSGSHSLYFRSRAAWEELFTQIGFQVQSVRCSHFLFADILYVCQKPAEPRSP